MGDYTSFSNITSPIFLTKPLTPLRFRSQQWPMFAVFVDLMSEDGSILELGL